MFALHTTVAPVAEEAWSSVAPSVTAHAGRVLGTMSQYTSSAASASHSEFATAIRSVLASGSGSSYSSFSESFTGQLKFSGRTSQVTETITAASSQATLSSGRTRGTSVTHSHFGSSYDTALSSDVPYTFYTVETSASASSTTEFVNSATHYPTATTTTATTTHALSRTVSTRSVLAFLTLGTTVGTTPSTTQVSTSLLRTLSWTGGSFSAATVTTLLTSWLIGPPFHSIVQTMYAEPREWLWMLSGVLPSASGLYPLTDLMVSGTSAAGHDTRYVSTGSAVRVQVTGSQVMTYVSLTAAGSFTKERTSATSMARTIRTVNETANGTTTTQSLMHTTVTHFATVSHVTTTLTFSIANHSMDTVQELQQEVMSTTIAALVNDSANDFAVTSTTYVGVAYAVRAFSRAAAFVAPVGAGASVSRTWTYSAAPVVLFRNMGYVPLPATFRFGAADHVAAGVFRASTAAAASDARYSDFTLTAAGAPVFLLGSNQKGFGQTSREQVISGGAAGGAVSWMGVRNAAVGAWPVPATSFFGGRSQQPGLYVFEHAALVGVWRATMRSANQATYTTSFAAMPPWANSLQSSAVTWAEEAARFDFQPGGVVAGRSGLANELVLTVLRNG